MKKISKGFGRDQKVHLLLNVIQNGELLAKVMAVLIQRNPERLQDCWDTLEKHKRLEIWDLMPLEHRNQLLLKGTLTKSQCKRLWDNLGKERRLSIWSNYHPKQKKYLMTLLSNLQRITLFVSLERAA